MGPTTGKGKGLCDPYSGGSRPSMGGFLFSQLFGSRIPSGLGAFAMNLIAAGIKTFFSRPSSLGKGRKG
jgi:hypothetical protein